MDIPLIQKTKEYNIFKYINFNRTKKKHHIEQVKKIIQKENLLHLHPILINEKMEVIDGQHRLEAAKELGLEVYYIQDAISYNHILNSNLYQKKLSLSDVIKFYAKKDGINSYIYLNKLVDRLNIKPKAILGLIFGGSNGPLIDFIKSGKFELPNNLMVVNKCMESYEKFKNFVKEKRITPFSIFSGSNFTTAYRNLVLLSNFDENIWYSKLENRWFELRPQLNSKEWTILLIGIYNWKNQNPLSYG